MRVFKSEWRCSEDTGLYLGESCANWQGLWNGVLLLLKSLQKINANPVLVVVCITKSILTLYLVTCKFEVAKSVNFFILLE